MYLNRKIGENGGMLTEFNKLLKIILTVPVLSCTAETSFSALRRLKTFLRSTMTQNRLNDIALFIDIDKRD